MFYFTILKKALLFKLVLFWKTICKMIRIGFTKPGFNKPKIKKETKTKNKITSPCQYRVISELKDTSSLGGCSRSVS